MRAPSMPGDLLGAQHLLEHRPVGADQHQPVRRVLLQAQPPVAGHRLGDVDEQRVRDGVAGVGQQRVDDLLGVVAGGAGVPQAERRQPVGVDVLRASARARRTARSPCGSRPPARGRSRAAASCRDWTIRGPSVIAGSPTKTTERAKRCSADGRLLAGAVRRDVGPRGAPVGAVAPGLVGRGVDVHVGARGRPRRRPAGSRRGRRPGSPGRAAPPPISSSATDAARLATCRCRSAGSWSEIIGVIGCCCISALSPAVTAGTSPAPDASKTGRSSFWNRRSSSGVPVGALAVQPRPRLEVAGAAAAHVGSVGVDQGADDSAYRMKSIRPSLRTGRLRRGRVDRPHRGDPVDRRSCGCRRCGGRRP